MNQYLEWFHKLQEPARKQVVAAAKWGDGPYTRLILQTHFPMFQSDEVPALISHFRTVEA